MAGGSLHCLVVRGRPGPRRAPRGSRGSHVLIRALQCAPNRSGEPMRRIGPLLLSLSCLALFASCTKAPDPKKAENIGPVEAADSSGAGNVGGALPAIPDGPVAT